MADIKKCCACCAIVWIILASILVAVGLGTDFWYTTIYKFEGTVSGDNVEFYRATTYGLEKFCEYPKEFNSVNLDENKKPDAKDIENTKNWACTKWKDLDGTTDSVDDCKKSVKVGMGFGILGLLLTAPAAIVCFMWMCCADCMFKFKTLANIITIALLFGVVFCYMISTATVAGECNKFNKDLDKLLYIGVNDTTTVPLWSMCFVIVSIFLALFAAISFWRFHCALSDCDHCENHCEDAQEARPSQGEAAPPQEGQSAPPQMDTANKPPEPNQADIIQA